MSIEVLYEVREDYVYARASGVFDQKSALGLFDAALNFTIASDRIALLIDARQIQGKPTTMERYEQGVLLAERKILGVCIAVVGDEPLIDPRRFGETVAVNRGAWGKAFTDIEAAIVWLKDSISEPR